MFDYLWLFVLRYAAVWMMSMEIPAISNIGVQPRGANSCRRIQRIVRPEPIHHSMPIRESR
jgi:hypothetical protein